MMLGATREKLAAGAIVLAHDGIGPGAQRDGAARDVRYVQRAAELAQRDGLAHGGPRVIGGAMAGSSAGALGQRRRSPSLPRARSSATAPARPRSRMRRSGCWRAVACSPGMRARAPDLRPATSWQLVRAVARADGSVGRIFDGHLNGVERLIVQGPEALQLAELPRIRAGELIVGVWGGQPRPGEGQPARIEQVDGHEVLCGVKTFCSGAGGLDRALVLAEDPGAELPSAVWVDAGDAATVKVDESWYRSPGLRASASHRVVFAQAPILARFGAPGALVRAALVRSRRPAHRGDVGGDGRYGV